ncbi:DtxR family transcriptional regulator [Desulfonema ishimotonii]|uniref:Transcriptional regulator MntR n=1 Tax=Desulfonema ishimotonii TaxID=45657 RepID=A0A401FTL7_9BACT|nr:metal-dependent transcriptional regulator [Desulfonema ishimotonii]GBC60294.1 DtxR family transcriptional regulator [Desulfonema ishimotonii]
MKTEAVENYLKTIYTVQQKSGRVKTSVLAEKLGVTSGSVTDMVKRMARMEPPLVAHTHHRGVLLTPAGEKAALDVIRRHRLLETFLHQVLGFQWHEVHAEAERLEHYISERLTDAIDAYLNHPAHDPHGDPIPGKGGQLAPETCVPLSEVPAGQNVRIARVLHSEPEMLQYLEQIGVTINARMTVREKAPFDGPIILYIAPEDRLQAISIRAARLILIEMLPDSPAGTQPRPAGQCR